MRENKRTSELARELRKIPNAVVFKHADMAMTGVPDITITILNNTLWLEGKMLDRGIKLTSLQHHNMTELERYGRALYVVFDRGSTRAWVVAPSDARAWNDFGPSVARHSVANCRELASWVRLGQWIRHA